MQSEMADFAPYAATWQTGRNKRVVFASGLFPPLYGNMTSTTKLEVRNVSHCHQRRTEQQPQVTRIENLVKFGRVVFVDKRADRQTDTLIAILCTPTGGE